MMRRYLSVDVDILHRSFMVANLAKCSESEAFAGFVRMVHTAERFPELSRIHLLGCFGNAVHVEGLIRALRLIYAIEPIEGTDRFRLCPGVTPYAAAQADKAASIIYFVRRGKSGPIKIGITTNLERRLRVLQTGSDEQIDVLATVPGSAREEAELHGQWKALRRKGEWFEASSELLTFIESLRYTGRLP